MVERFIINNGTISVAMGGSVVTGVGTTFGGRDLEAAMIWAVPPSGNSPPSASPPQFIGFVGAVEPRGIYDDLSLPLVVPYLGAALTNVAYVLVYGPAIANGATQAAVFGRFVSNLENNLGLVANYADLVDTTPEAFIPNNTAYFDIPTKMIWLWTDGVLEPAVAGFPFDDAGLFADRAAHDAAAAGYVYYSIDEGVFYRKNSSAGGDWSPAVGVTGLSSGASLGTALVDFGAFPGSSNVSLAITGQSAIAADSIVDAWIIPATTADHSLEEHLAEPPRVHAGNVVAGVGFTIYGMTPISFGPGLCYGKWNVGWGWHN